jgi:hypothetical protein
VVYVRSRERRTLLHDVPLCVRPQHRAVPDGVILLQVRGVEARKCRSVGAELYAYGKGVRCMHIGNEGGPLNRGRCDSDCYESAQLGHDCLELLPLLGVGGRRVRVTREDHPLLHIRVDRRIGVDTLEARIADSRHIGVEQECGADAVMELEARRGRVSLRCRRGGRRW